MSRQNLLLRCSRKKSESTLQALQIIGDELGPENIELTLGYVGMIHSNFPVNAVYQWSRGPEEAILHIGLSERLHLSDEVMKERVRERLASEMRDVRFSFEPSDIVNEVMSFGSPTPIEVVVSGADFTKSREFAETLRNELAQVPALRDLQLGQSMDYPTVQVNVDREKAGMAGLMPIDVSRALVTATSSSRFVVPNYWADPKSGVAYQVQVELPRPVVRSPYDVETIGSVAQLGRIPLRKTANRQALIQDVATLERGTMPGQYDRYNMKRQITLTANEALALIDSAKARQREAEANVLTAQADIDAAKAKLKVAQSDIAQAETMLTYTELTAPFDGFVTSRHVDAGHYVQPAGSSNTKPLMTVANVSKVRVFVNVPESEAGWVDAGFGNADADDPVTILSPSLPNGKIGSRVTRTSLQLDPQSRSLSVEIDLDNSDLKLLPGAFVTTKMLLEQCEDVLTLPTGAIVKAADGIKCCVVIDGKIEYRPIELGLRTGDDVEITSGLNGSETVVLLRAGSLESGQSVEMIRKK